ncbi:uncharacterized protein LOC119724370 [Patiria miniata]|uniref:Uncharacterized protein n=1 Tax=Patiria miniata TaxID=46514 RepID=A0A913ZJS7_PATMI|nr:uncharacterized protein LOC119724370 [Patiria miniata]
MSLSVILEEPSGFQEGDLEFVGRVPRSPRRPHTYSGKKREKAGGRHGSPTGRYIRAAAGRSLGGLRPNSQSYFPNAPGAGPRRRNPEPRVIGFARNPRHPKSLYDTEISMRHFMKGAPKVTSEMSFPDPKNRGLRNPMAPRFHHEFDLTAEDYEFQINPMAGVDMDVLLSGPSMAGTYNVNRGFDETAEDGIDSTEQSSDSEEAESDRGEGADDVSVDDSAPRRAEEAPRGDRAIYSSVNKFRSAPQPVADPIRSEPPPFAPRPPPPPDQPMVIPRAVASQDEPPSYLPQQQDVQLESKEVQVQLEALHTLAEEEEDQQEMEQLEVDDSQEIEAQVLRDMSTQTNVTVQDVSEPVEQDEAETDDRFIQIGDGREDSATMTHGNWEAVAPWSQRSSGQAVTRSESLAVNYRRVVAELSGAERPREPQDEPPRRQESERRQPREERTLPARGEPPPWSPPIVPQVEQILRPMEDDMRNYPPPSREWDPPSRRYYHGNRVSMADICNRCCFVILLLLAVGVIVGIIVVTALYVSSTDCGEQPCGLLQQPGYLAGFVALGALAILILFALFTWCCYNVTRRQRNQHKYRPRERQMYWQ